MNLRYILQFTLISAKSIRVNYPYIISNLSFPLALLFVVAISSQGRTLPYALAGGLIAIVAMNGITASTYLSSFRFTFKYQDLIVATDTSRIDYMLGGVFAGLIWTIPSAILFFLLDIYYKLLTPYSFAISVVVALLVTLASVSIAFWVSGYMKRNHQVWSVAILLSLIMITIPPTFYPYTYLPKSILYLLMLFPTTSAVMIEQGVFSLSPFNLYLIPVLIIETVAYFMVAKYLTRWREN